MKYITVIGTQGVPANYGGFESLVENIISEYKSPDIEYTVFCSSRDLPEKREEYKGAKLKYLSLSANGIQSIPYDMLSLLKIPKKTDIILVLGVSGSLILPFFRLFSKKRLIINIDGLEHRRDKWGKVARTYLKLSEKMAVKYADIIIADNKGIQDYVKKEYGKESILIAYGGDHVIQKIGNDEKTSVLGKYGLQAGEYAFSVCRIEPENNVHITLEAYKQAGKDLVFVGNWQKSEYGKRLYEQYSVYPNIHLLTPIYDLRILNVLRSNCSVYIHGHSAGGTNPSLVEAMFFKKPIYAFDVVYNRETTENKASYFSDVDSLKAMIRSSTTMSENAQNMYEIANRRYCWKEIVKQYERLYQPTTMTE